MFLQKDFYLILLYKHIGTNYKKNKMNLSTSFFENAVMLLLTACLTGIIVPLLFRYIDKQRNEKQKIFEAELLRQEKIIESQELFLDHLSELFWEYQLLLIDVSYYHQFPEMDIFKMKLKAYEENSGKLLGKIRAEISKAIRLTPLNVFEQLKQFYYQELLPVDLRLTVLVSKEAKNNDEWLKLNAYAVYTLSEKVDMTIDMLANQLELKVT